MQFHRSWAILGALAGALATAGCSGAANVGGFDSDGGGGNGGNGGNGASDDGAIAVDAGGGGEGPGQGDARGGGAGDDAAAGGGGGGGADAGSEGDGALDAGAAQDARGISDAGARPDARAGSDAGARMDATAGPDGASEGGVLGDGGDPCADQDVWLTPMNQVRAGVGESPLVCDPIAVQVAFNYASQCNYAHNMNRNSDYTALGGHGGVGENIAAGAPTETIAAAVNSWNAEAQFYDHATNTCATGQECGHYTQIVWKTTTGVGCAHVSCTMNSPFMGTGNGKWDFSVCDYSPPGNLVVNGVVQPPY